MIWRREVTCQSGICINGQLSLCDSKLLLFENLLSSIVTTFQQLIELFSFRSGVVNLMISWISMVLSAVFVIECRMKEFEESRNGIL